MRTEAIQEFAAAKINLSLAVGPLAADGYHPVNSLIAFADIGDRLSFHEADTIKLEICGPFANQVPAGGDNLVYRAASILRKSIGAMPGVHIRLEKNLPVSAGIGGGSADAAATLRGTNRLWSGRLSLNRLSEIGVGLGSDVPVCVRGETARVQGRGERLETIANGNKVHALLVNPGVAVSTAAVFARYDTQEARQSANSSLQAVDVGQNDLLPAAISLCPQIEETLLALEKLPDLQFGSLCGSGATCMGVFASREAVVFAQDSICTSYPHWWVKSTIVG